MPTTEAASEIPYDTYVFASNAAGKIKENALVLHALARSQKKKVRAHSINHENIKAESASDNPAEVAQQKNIVTIDHLKYDNPKTAALAWDVVTLYEGNKDLKKLSRKTSKIDPTLPASEQWKQITGILKRERRKMKERFTERSFFIEWQVAFALCSADKEVQRTAVLVIRKTFEPFTRAYINSVFSMGHKLMKMRQEKKVPTEAELADNLLAFLIGPGIAFAELEGKAGVPVTVHNRDYPEEQYMLEPHVLVKLVRDCALPPHAMLALLTGQVKEGQEDRGTFYIDLSNINDYDTIRGDLKADYAGV